MFIPLFIAILLGLVNPSHTNSNCNNGGTVQVNSTDPGNEGGGDDGGGDDGGGTDPGNDGPGAGGPGGNTGQNPPPPPKP